MGYIMTDEGKKREKVIDQDVNILKSSSAYSGENVLIKEYYRSRIIERLENDAVNISKCSALDMGLGKGFNTDYFSNRFGSYTVIEGDSDVIELYRKNHSDSGVNVINSYFEDYETENRYDVIIAGFILEHVLNPVKIISKYKGLLTENGRMYIAVPNSTSMHRQLGKLSGDLKDLCELSDTDRKYGHRRYYSIETLTRDIEEAGMNVSSMEGLYLKPFTTGQIKSLNLKEKYQYSLCELGRLYPELSAGIMAECINCSANSLRED